MFRISLKETRHDARSGEGVVDREGPGTGPPLNARYAFPDKIEEGPLVAEIGDKLTREILGILGDDPAIARREVEELVLPRELPDLRDGVDTSPLFRL
jgi:hypothetical protein